VQKLVNAIERYPNNSTSWKNYLIRNYTTAKLNETKEDAMKPINGTIAEHPNYLFES